MNQTKCFDEVDVEEEKRLNKSDRREKRRLRLGRESVH